MATLILTPQKTPSYKLDGKHRQTILSQSPRSQRDQNIFDEIDQQRSAFIATHGDEFGLEQS